MKIFSKNGVELHKHSNQSGTTYKLYVKGKYYPFPKLRTPLNSKTEVATIPPAEDKIVRVKYVCQACGHTSMEAEVLKACTVICTECRGVMLPPVKVKRLATIRKCVKRKGLERF